MCTGVEIAALVGAVVAAAGTTAAAVSSSQQAKAAGKAAKQQAEYTRLVASRNEEDYRRRQLALMATRRALMGGSGIDPGVGTPLLVDSDIAGEIEYNALTIRSGGEAEATRLENQARLFKSKAASESLAGYGRAGSLLIGGASGVDWGGGADPYAFGRPAQSGII